MKNYIIFTSCLLMLGGMSLGLGSCNKKQDTFAKITVRDTANAIVPDARVILFGTSTTLPTQPVERRDTVYTDASGVALFNYNEVYQEGQAGVAVLDIRARKGNLSGAGIIKVEEEIRNEATVLIQP
ncbi:hypothetical protein [Brumimicrobium mesophilum]|uniref:hypothetical protein n=1 Tax=Brumimicrobium mesophilum TaxID=392717 RepID=UPI00131DD1F6|nr:hypothetical protein [Brumimicrobium mesophilum]